MGNAKRFPSDCGKTPLHVYTCSQPFPKRLSRPEFPAFSTIAAASIGHALQHKSDPPKRQENQICYIASQVVGSKGRVIGVDMNDDMLALARKYRQSVGNALGYHNVELRKGKIQDLALDQERLEAHLASHPVRIVKELEAVGRWKEKERRENPMIPSASIDVVVSNYVLNLVDSQSKSELFRERHRVLKRGGRVVISDIVSDEDVPEHLQADPRSLERLYFRRVREDLFLKAFEEAGFYGIEILSRTKNRGRASRASSSVRSRSAPSRGRKARVSSAIKP